MGLTGVKRCASLNDSPHFIAALADIASKHLNTVPFKGVSTQMMLRCPGCVNEKCGEAKEWFKAFEKDLVSTSV